VLLARPLGGREGMLFDNSMADSSSINLLNSAAAGSRPQKSLNGIAVMLESMRRFESEAKLQAMACWAMVNIALAPAQKHTLISLGGIQAALNAMSKHPYIADVQFRALFALINLVIPCKYMQLFLHGCVFPCIFSFWTHHFRVPLLCFLSIGNDNTTEGSRLPIVQDKNRRKVTEKEILDEIIEVITGLVVSAMENFCSSETILNRACLVLHNLSQNQDYISTLLWTPHCYQMLEWCIANHPTDKVLRRSAVTTLHRLQVALSNDNVLKARFTESLRVERALSIKRQRARCM
jgi:hypothetical protein